MKRIVLLLLVSAVLLVPIVQASHNMGHRYLVYGRLLDAAGMPIQNQDVEIRLIKQGTFMSSIISKTDCLGDFDSWKGRQGATGEADLDNSRAGGEGNGEIESIPQSGSRPAYVNFHFHDPMLTSLYHFELKVLNESWEESFHSDVRQSVVHHQLAATGTPGCGNYDEFNNTFEVRVYLAHQSEMTYRNEPVFVSRSVAVTYDNNGQAVKSNGTVDFMYTYVAKLNATPKDGDRILIQAQDLGTKSFRLGAEDIKYHRANSVNVMGAASSGGSLNDFRYFGIFLLAVALVIGLYFASVKLKARREEARLRQGSTRRRFRKERGGDGQ